MIMHAKKAKTLFYEYGCKCISIFYFDFFAFGFNTSAKLLFKFVKVNFLCFQITTFSRIFVQWLKTKIIHELFLT